MADVRAMGIASDDNVHGNGAEDDGMYDGVSARELAARLRVPRVIALDATPSTQDVAHALGEAGAPAGTLVLADRQTQGRGRQGRRWVSAPGAGIWLTLVERALDPAAVGVLSIRLGLAAAPVLERFADAPVRLKWPNDLHVGTRKLAGILAEARWRRDRLEWVAIGFGVNVIAPSDVDTGVGLAPGTSRLDVLAALVPALRAACALRGELRAEELAAFAERDLARGRRCTAPLDGRVLGIAADGALVVDVGGDVRRAHSGSLILLPEEAT